MKLRRHPDNPILEPDPVQWYSRAVYNPCVWLEEGTFHMLFRAETVGDPCTGHIGLAYSADGIRFTTHPEPVIVPEHDYEARGCEDPRVVKIGDTYYLTYVGNDGRYRVSHICLATSTDLYRWEKHGVVLHPREGRWNSGQIKAAAIAPLQIGGCYVMFYLGERRPWETAIGLAYSDDLIHWQEPEESIVLEPRPAHFDSQGVEPGPPPILVNDGLLLVYNGWDADHVHRSGLVLLSPEDPRRVIARTDGPILAPQEPWERVGHASNVVFSEGLVRRGNTWHLYYGAADRVIGLAIAEADDLIALYLKDRGPSIAE